MPAFTFPIPLLRFGEFDLGGVLYHANYFHVYEQAREALLAAGPLPYAELVRQGCHLAIVESNQKFLKPVRYGEPLTIEVRVENLKRASFDFCYTFLTTAEVHRARTSMVFVQSDGGVFSVKPLPSDLKTHLERFLTQSDNSRRDS